MRYNGRYKERERSPFAHSPPILKPDFYLAFGQAQTMRDLDPASSR